MTQEKLLHALQWRYAVKKFDRTKKISKADWSTLEDALVLTPSSYGLQPWKFLVVTSQEVKDKLTPASWNQTQVADCSHYVVFLAKNEMTEKDIERFISRTAQVRGVAPETMQGYQKIMVSDVVTGPRSKWVKEWATRQTYIALGNLMTSAAVIGIDTCPMEGLDPAKYDEILRLSGSGYHTVMACAVGYRSADDKYQHAKKVRFESEDVVRYL